MMTMKHNGHNGHRRPDEIEAEIERKRSELDETLSAIERRLTPGQIVDQGLDYLRGSSAREYVRNLGESVKREPIPLVLVGVGLAWLMLSDRRSRSAPQGDFETDWGSSPPADWEPSLEDSSPSITERMADAKRRLVDKAHATGERVSDAAGSARERAAGVAGSARESAEHVAGTVRESASRAAGTARQVAGTVRERASMVAGTTRERMSYAADTARHQAERVRSGYDQLVHEQPLALGAIGLAIGAVLGAVAPRTRQEDRLMGPTRDRLAHDLEDAAREPLERAVQAASAAADTAVDTFRSPFASENSSWSSTQSSTKSSRPSVMPSDTGPGPQESGPGVVAPAGYAADGANTRSDIDAALDDTPAVGRDLTPSDDHPGASGSNRLGGR